MKKRWLLAVVSILIGNAYAGEILAPGNYSDVGACPFECCSYRDWIVEALKAGKLS